MVPLLLALVSPAFAAEGNGRAGLAWPGAAPTGHGLGEVALGTGLAIGGEAGEPMNPAWSSSANLVLHPGERWAFETQAVFGPGHLVGVAGARYAVLQREHLSLAPWVGALLLGPAPSTGWDLLPAAGLALDLRGERFGFDLSAPLVGALLLREEPMFMPMMVVMGEIGGSWYPTEATSLRLGLASYFVTLRWRHELGERWFYEVDVGTVGTGLYQARGGLRF